MVPFQFMVYTPFDKSYKTLEDVKSDESYKTISGTELRKILDSGDEIPQWFSYPEVANELKKSVNELCQTLTLEEMIGWAAFYDIRNEEQKKEQDKTQRRSVIPKSR